MTSSYFTPLTTWLQADTTKFFGVYTADLDLTAWLPRGANTRPKMDITYNTVKTVASITLDFGGGRAQVLSNIPIAELDAVLDRLNTLL